MSSVVKLLERAVIKCHEIHEHRMSEYFPGKGNGGIHEFNHVLTFIEALQNLSGYDNVVAWTEVQCLHKKRKRSARLDAAIKLKNENIIILLEAKRIRQGKTRGSFNSSIAIKSIRNDTKRLIEIDESEPVVSASKTNAIYRVMLASMWLSDDRNMQDAYEKWKSHDAFDINWKGCVVSESVSKSTEKHLKLLLAVKIPHIKS
ncbi:MULTISPECIES: hypothetical protein [unclassified Shewanella]|uniref:hypothetical protein n=1 Tax=unclassified Shewanella TaxID=196818 RepID=UPI000C848AB4|nr:MULTISPECIES: hypothetical protein [unclassified Shewanella]MDO6678587.1 hypothetical protein [Shewanella sp. 4_MG-2023]PMH88195.1 hypothetical protein BCU57_20065 [Shewanella sp. 10N.286.48.B5]